MGAARLRAKNRVGGAQGVRPADDCNAKTPAKNAVHQMRPATNLSIVAVILASALAACNSPMPPALSQASQTPSLRAAPQVRLVAAGTMIAGRVVGVADGDSITLLDASNVQHKIRLAAIDAPERTQPYSQQAKLRLSDLTFDRQVTAMCGKVDRYGRDVCKVFSNGVDVNLEQVRAGLAWHYRQYEREQTEADRSAYASAEATARTQRLGLWSLWNPIEPWTWRKEAASRTAVGTH